MCPRKTSRQVVSGKYKTSKVFAGSFVPATVVEVWTCGYEESVAKEKRSKGSPGSEFIAFLLVSDVFSELSFFAQEGASSK